MKLLKLRKVILAFQKALQKQGKHPNTVRSYTNDIVQFSIWLKNTYGNDLDLDNLTYSDILDYRAFLLTRGTSAASTNRKITALRQFFEYVGSVGFTSMNPVESISGVHQTSTEPQVLSRRDALLLIRTAEKQGNAFETSVLLLLLHAGLRSSEICGLNIGDLYLTPREGKIFIRGQRGKTMRFVYLSTRTQAALRRYCKRMSIRILARRRREEPLFKYGYSGAFTQHTVDQIVKRVSGLCGLDLLSPSALRNTYAVLALLAGESDEDVARTMGVSSIKNLVGYAKRVAEQ